MLWDQSLETGVAQVDEQHQELFNRIEALLSATKEGRGKEKIKETLDFLEAYIIKHFDDEYALQKGSNYPKARMHKLYHDNYIQSLAELKKRYQIEGDTLNIMLAVNRSIIGWLTEHINKHDREFAEYYRSRT